MKDATTNIIDTYDGMLVSTDQKGVPDAILQSTNQLHTFGNFSAPSWGDPHAFSCFCRTKLLQTPASFIQLEWCVGNASSVHTQFQCCHTTKFSPAAQYHNLSCSSKSRDKELQLKKGCLLVVNNLSWAPPIACMTTAHYALDSDASEYKDTLSPAKSSAHFNNTHSWAHAHVCSLFMYTHIVMDEP